MFSLDAHLSGKYMRLFVVATSFIISSCVFYEHDKMLKLTHFKNLY